MVIFPATGDGGNDGANGDDGEVNADCEDGEDAVLAFGAVGVMEVDAGVLPSSS
jgi:hypothetical protein